MITLTSALTPTLSRIGLIFTHRLGEGFRVKELPRYDNVMQALKAPPEDGGSWLTISCAP
jgi:hypothetical protein